jgi:hypothetical protein
MRFHRNGLDNETKELWNRNDSSLPGVIILNLKYTKIYQGRGVRKVPGHAKRNVHLKRICLGPIWGERLGSESADLWGPLDVNYSCSVD